MEVRNQKRSVQLSLHFIYQFLLKALDCEILSGNDDVEICDGVRISDGVGIYDGVLILGDGV